MAIAFVPGVWSAGTAGTAVTSLTSASVSLTAGNLFVFATINLPAGGTISDTAGNTFVSCGPAINGLRLFYAANCLGNASNKIMANFTSASFVAIFAAQYSGVATGSPLDVVPASANGAAGSGTVLSTGLFSTGRANEVIVALASGSDGTPSATGNFTSRVAGVSFSNILEDWIPTTLQTNVAATASQGSTAAWQIVAASFASTNNTVATPTFNPVAGTYTGTQIVTVSDANSGLAGFAMYYTLDGSTPTTGSTPYSGPISVASSLTLKVLAVATGYNNSAVGSAAYTIIPAAGGQTGLQLSMDAALRNSGLRH